MKSILTFFKVAVILFWIALIALVGSFVFFGEQIIDFAYSIPFLVELKETLGLNKESIESILILSAIIMVPVSITTFSLSRKLNLIKAPEVEQTPVAVVVEAKKEKVVKAKAIKIKAEPKEKEPVQLSPYYEVGLTGIKLKRQ